MLNLIVNPYAGGGLATSNTKAITKYLKKENIPYLVYFCEKESDVVEFSSELIKSGEKDFVLIGGDGTVHKFINSVDLNKVNFGIVPSGNFNNFAKSIAIEFNPIKAIENIIAQNIEHFDYLKCGEIKVLNCVAIGCIEEIKHKLKDEKHKPNTFDYLRNLNKCEPIELTFTHRDIKDKKQTIDECYICNGNYMNMSTVSPLSNVQDGLCNLICVTNTGKRKISEYLKIKSGKHIYDEQNKTYWLENVCIQSNTSPIRAIIDGEMYELENLEITTIEGGLNIYI